MEVDIKMIGPTIKAKVGDVVTLKAEFAEPCWSCIHERQEGLGYERLHDQKDSRKHVYAAVIHPKTTHFVFSIGDNGRPDVAMTSNVGQIWCPVEIVTGEVKEDKEADLGKYLYSVGALSDYHLCADNDNATSSTSDDWWDEDDFKACMDVFVENPYVKFVIGCGDVAECGSPKKGTPEQDYKLFNDIYNVPYWQQAGLRFFTPMGNHDFYGLFESRAGDTIVGGKNSETVAGYNASVNARLSNWVMNQMISYVVPTGRITFELENGKHTMQGQADMNFFAYNAYTDLYASKAGYSGSVWDSGKGGISDKAISLTRKYVNDNWNSCRNNLSGWKDSGLHGRNNYSKLSFYMKKDNWIYICLSVDYGDDKWGVNNEWHDRMIHARTIIDLNSDDPYIKAMKEYVEDTGYSSFDEPYNYQYYSPNSLIWVKEIIENNPDKNIILFHHHFSPNRVGNSNGIPQEGAYSYAEISKAGELTSAGINKGSNVLTGIEFWFIDKLLNEHKNVFNVTGHSHISLENKCNIDNHDYDIVSPSTGGKYAYTKANATPIKVSAYSVSLPSMSKPRGIKDNQSERLYDDAELAILDIHEKGLRFRGYKVRKNNFTVFDKNNPIIDEKIQLT